MPGSKNKIQVKKKKHKSALDLTSVVENNHYYSTIKIICQQIKAYNWSLSEYLSTNLTKKNCCLLLQGCVYTKGVLASKFPISISTNTHGCQKIRKMPKNYVPVSDFATRQLNLRKPQKSQNFCKKCNFISKKNFFRVLFVHPWYLFYRKYFLT